ncbi:laminin subunit alpha-3-like [Denticeps clupeoides]|uniref:laminin subunit alpha-3-like n=1 Tax=Denticeps clupeoides TaxID=299321 RepID=UPI0010A48420|nr:laminin subunit alpha-3-like [Denticeps clupeoides]
METLKRDLKTTLNDLNNINQVDIGLLIDSAKEGVSSANATVTSVRSRLESIDEGLKNLTVPSVELNLDEILNNASEALTGLNQTFPQLINKTEELENLSSVELPTSNVSHSIWRIRKLIETTRLVANSIGVPMMFNGQGHVELRPPTDLTDLRAYTDFDLLLHRPKLDSSRGDGGRRRRQVEDDNRNTFVLYLGNKDSSKDFVGMVLRNNVLYCVYRLGGVYHEVMTTDVSRSSRDAAHFDKVDFRRVYQDAQVIYTRKFAAKLEETLPAFPYRSTSSLGLLDVQRDSVVFYVGGFPHNFTPPVEFGRSLSPYQGCIKFFSHNNKPISLYNFQQATHINQERPCSRLLKRVPSEYFDGSGYGMIQMKQPDTMKRRIISFSVQSRLMDSVLFYIENENSFYLLTVEKGFLVLQGRRGEQVHVNRSSTQQFPTMKGSYLDITIRLDRSFDVYTDVVSLSVAFTRDIYQEFYIGGVPAILRHRDNITSPPLKGCLQSSPKMDGACRFYERVGVTYGCQERSLEVFDAAFDQDASLVLDPAPTVPFGSMVSLGFRSTKAEGILLQTSQEAQVFELSLMDGFVEFRNGNRAVRSSRTYNNGEWHYLTAIRDGVTLGLRVDNVDEGSEAPDRPTANTAGNRLILGKTSLRGCLGLLYTRSDLCKITDLSDFSRVGQVNVGFCGAERPPQAFRVNNRKHKRNRQAVEGVPHHQRKSCPSSAVVPHAYNLGSNRSQMSFSILPEELNFRPHFFMRVKTTSSEGLLLHVSSKQKGSYLALYLTSGKFHLSVGNSSIFYSRRINDENSFQLGASFDLDFKIRAHQGPVAGAVLLYISVRRRSITVYLKDGLVTVRANDGGGDYNVSVVAPRHLCHSFHQVKVQKLRNEILLEVGSRSQKVAGPSRTSYGKNTGPFYMGGVPDALKPTLGCVSSSFTGCVRDVLIGGKEVLLASAHVLHGPVSVHGCPAN